MSRHTKIQVAVGNLIRRGEYPSAGAIAKEAGLPSKNLSGDDLKARDETFAHFGWKKNDKTNRWEKA
jgi:hypothetical protein